MPVQINQTLLKTDLRVMNSNNVQVAKATNGQKYGSAEESTSGKRPRQNESKILSKFGVMVGS